MPTASFYMVLLISLTAATSASPFRKKIEIGKRDNELLLLIGDVIDGVFGTYLNVFNSMTQSFVVPVVGTGIFNYIG